MTRPARATLPAPASRPALALLLAGAVAVPALAACSTSGAASAAAPTGAATTSSSPATSATPSPSTSSASPTTTATAVVAPRSQSELKTALLALTDLPTGFSLEKGGDDGPQPTFSATDAGCRDLVGLLNTPSPSGSVASAEVAFSGGQQGPFVDEGLDAMPSAAHATTALEGLATAVSSCDRATLELPGDGRAEVDIVPVSPPQAGTHATALRVTAVDGSALEGLELTLVATQVDDVTVSMSFLGATPDDVDGATQAAVQKVTDELGRGPGSAASA